MASENLGHLPSATCFFTKTFLVLMLALGLPHLTQCLPRSAAHCNPLRSSTEDGTPAPRTGSGVTGLWCGPAGRWKGLLLALRAAKARTAHWVLCSPSAHHGSYPLMQASSLPSLFRVITTNCVNYIPRFWPPVDRIIIFSPVTCQCTEHECIF